MARGTQFATLVYMLRAELRRSVAVNVGVDDLPDLKQAINRQYAIQWAATEWPFLCQFYPVLQLNQGQQYYNLPTGVDGNPLTYDRIKTLALYFSGIPQRIERGITFEDYALFDPDTSGSSTSATITITGGTNSPGVNTFSQAYVGTVPLLAAPVDWVGSNSQTAFAIAAQINALSANSGYTATAVNNIVTIMGGALPNSSIVTFFALGNLTAAATNMAVTFIGTGAYSDPVMKWDIRYGNAGQEQIEVWPVPSSNIQYMRFFGFIADPVLINDSDLCLLDDMLVVLFAAADCLAFETASPYSGALPGVAQRKLDQAKEYLAILKSNMQSGRSTVAMGMGRPVPFINTDNLVRVRG